MAVIGFNLTKILVERKGPIKGGVKVNTNMNITDVKKEDIVISQSKDTLNFDFNFSINYKSASSNVLVADILFEGRILYLVDPKDTKKILEDWKKKTIDDSIRVPLLNSILAKCNIKALVLEEEIGLPSHIPLPSFKGKQEKKK